MSDGISKVVANGAVETRVRSIDLLGLPGGGAEWTEQRTFSLAFKLAT